MHGLLDADRMGAILRSPTAIHFAAAIPVFVAVSGGLSLLALRRLPDFPHKREMVWGARCCHLIVGCILCVSWLVALLGVTRTSHGPIFLFAAALVLLLLPAATVHPLYWQWVGAGFWLEPWWSRVRGKQFDVLEAVVETKRTRGQWETGILCLAAVGVAALALAVWAGMRSR